MTTAVPTQPRIVFEGIYPGDFIRTATFSHVTGFVIAPGWYGNKRNGFPGYRVQLANGSETFISEDEAVLVSASEPRWQMAVQLVTAARNADVMPAEVVVGAASAVIDSSEL